MWRFLNEIFRAFYFAKVCQQVSCGVLKLSRVDGVPLQSFHSLGTICVYITKAPQSFLQNPANKHRGLFGRFKVEPQSLN